jgi:Mrp family chromosome partitioning ATPase
MKQIADVVIIDTPAFVVPDAAVLAPKVDGVIFVARYGYTRKAAAKAVLEQLNQIGAKTIGVVLNWVSQKDMIYGDYYSYHRYSYYGEDVSALNNGYGKILNFLREKLGTTSRGSDKNHSTDVHATEISDEKDEP